MKIIGNNLLIMSTILVINLCFFGCSSKKYINPKSEVDSLILGEANLILRNVAINLNEINTNKLQQIEVFLYRKKFSVSSNFTGKKLLLPAQGNLTTFEEKDQESYLKIMCNDNLDCQEKLIKYNSIYYLLHELFHMVNIQNYKSRHSTVYAKNPNGKSKIMSFDEEIKAESVVVKYLSIYEPLLLEDYKILFSKILKDKKFDMDPNKVEQNWNTFKLRDFKQINNAKLYFFIYASKQIDESSLEELLYGSN
jgi:hypothetical protein